jgi:integrase
MRSLVSVLSDYIVKYYDEEYPMYRNFIKNTIERMPKTAIREKTILKEEDVNRLLKWLRDNGKIQEACFLCLAINSGARISELLQFKTSFIDENRTAYTDNMFLETTEELRTKGRGKIGHRMHKYIIKDAFLPYFYSWIEERKKLEIETDYLFVNSVGKPATTQTVSNWLKRWEKYLDENIYAHSFRHYFVTQLTRIGMPTDFIVEVMVWKTADMYKVYNDLTGKDKEWTGMDILKKYLESDSDE